MRLPGRLRCATSPETAGAGTASPVRDALPEATYLTPGPPTRGTDPAPDNGHLYNHSTEVQ